MRRLTKFLLTLSLMLSLGWVGLWIRSYFEYDVLHYEARSGFQTNAYSVRGKVMLYHANLYWEERNGLGMHYWRLSAGSQKGRDVVSDFDWSNGRHFWNRLGFKLLSRHGPFGPMVHIVVVSAPPLGSRRDLRGVSRAPVRAFLSPPLAGAESAGDGPMR